MKLLKLLLILAIAIIPTLLFATPVLAIDSPDTLTINAVYAYQNCVRTGDELFIVDYTIDYSSNPTEDARDAFLLRMNEGVTVLNVAYPYVYLDYNDDGYARGVATFYYDPDDALAWVNGYTVQVAGNPVMSWSGDVPEYSTSTFDEWNSNAISITQGLISSQILELAETLTRDWDTAYPLYEVISGDTYLSEYGEHYFTMVMSNIELLAPYALSDAEIYPDMYDFDYTASYSEQLEDEIENTPFDLTALGTEFNMSRGAITAILYYLCVLFFGVILIRRMGTHKPVILLLAPLTILGAFIGVPLQVTIVIAFISLFLIGWALFYKPAAT